MGNKDLEIWTLGINNSNADKSITWDQTFPNFNEPDVLIIDLNSLTDEILERINKSKLCEARNQIFNKFVNGGTIIFIIAPNRQLESKTNNNIKGQPGSNTKDIKSKVIIRNPSIYSSYSNYYLSPIEFTTTNVIEGKKIIYHENTFFSSYLSTIHKFSYYLHNFNISHSFIEIDPTNDMMSTIIKWIDRQSNNVSNANSVDLVTRRLASDNSNNTISAECWIKIDGYWNSGKSIYLSAPTNGISIDDAIDLIMDKYDKSITSQIIPDWVYNVSLATLSDLKTSLSALISDKAALDEEIKKKADKIKSTQKYYRLLVSKDKLLAKAAADAFKFLGIEDVEEKGGADEEDLIFPFRGVSEFKVGVIEVHGTEKNTPLDKLGQCHKWVENHLLQLNERAKGIVISNQHINESYPESKAKRIKFEPNELDYIKVRNMCIIPSCVLFEAVNKALGGTKTPRDTLERIIESSNEVIDTL